MTLVSALSLIFPVCLIWAMISDLRSLEIPNWLCLVLALSFFPVAAAADFSLVAMVWRGGIGFIMLLLGFAMYATNLFGGGDGKLLAAATIWTGHEALPGFLFYVAIFGGLLGLFVFLLRRYRWAGEEPKNIILANLANPQNGIPYGVAIGLGGLFVFPWLPGLS